MKLNSDGSMNKEHHAACGGIVRNELGQFAESFVVNLGVCPITVAKIWGAFYVLDFAWRRGFRRVIIELDSTTALALIRNEGAGHHPYGLLIARVQEHLHRDWMVHVYREANKTTDYLANLGHFISLGVYYYLQPHLCLRPILRDDLVGVAQPKLLV